MRRQCGQSGMTLMEVLVALAIVLILISALVGVGSYVKTRAEIDLTAGTLQTLSTALAQYYDDFGKFPFETDTNDDNVLDALDSYIASFLEADLGVAITSGVLEEQDGSTPPVIVPTASSAALFYFLDKNPASREIAAAVDDSLVTNKDVSGTDIKIDIGGTEYDLPRYIDPWGMSIRYEYLPGTAFPVLTSAGPDKVFDTPDDVTSK